MARFRDVITKARVNVNNLSSINQCFCPFIIGSFRTMVVVNGYQYVVVRYNGFGVREFITFIWLWNAIYMRSLFVYRASVNGHRKGDFLQICVCSQLSRERSFNASCVWVSVNNATCYIPVRLIKWWPIFPNVIGRTIIIEVRTKRSINNNGPGVPFFVFQCTTSAIICRSIFNNRKTRNVFSIFY